MSIDVLPLAGGVLGGALGGAALQSALGPVFGQRQQRRELRTTVVDCLDKVEERRKESLWEDNFLSSISGLKSAARKAGLNSEPVELYVSAASQARRALPDSFGMIRRPRAPAVDEMNQHAESAAAILRSYAMHPHKRRASLGKSIRSLKREQSSIEEKLASSDEKP